MTELFKAGFAVTDDQANIVTLVGTTSASARFHTLETPTATDYTVPANFNLVITRAIFTPLAANYAFQLGHGTDGKGDDTNPPADAVALTGYIYAGLSMQATTYDFLVVIPSGKLPYYRSQGGGGYLTLICVLTPV